MSCKLSFKLSLSCEYEIEIGSGLLFSQAPYLKSLASRFAIITDERVATLYGKRLLEDLAHADLNVSLFTFLGTEVSKTRETKEHVENQLFEAGFGRDSCILALGGGVSCDLAGFIAATYCRAIPYVMLPTSLLAMVDASIGGKTGVNVPYGKNLIGAIYQPKKVVIDTSTLVSLTKKELSQGLSEMIKHGLIADESFFCYLEEHIDAFLALQSPVLEQAIFTSCRIKKQIVENDVGEQGERYLLNFGHTVAHALEKLSGYTLVHGEAVAIGLLVESYLSLLLGYLDHSLFERIKALLLRAELPLKLPITYPVETLLEAMMLDKKALRNRPRFTLISGIGKAIHKDNHYCFYVEEKLLIKALEWMNHDLSCC